MKKKLRGTRFRNIQELQEAVIKLLRQTPKKVFQDAMLQLPIRWHKCVLAGGEYFEGKHLGNNLEIVKMSTDESDRNPDTSSESDD